MSRTRARARRQALQAVYQWQVTNQDISEVTQQFLEQHAGDRFDVEFFRDLVQGVARNSAEIDGWLQPCLDRSIASVDPVERGILRLGAYEFAYHPEVPYRVVINEAVELAKTFGATDGHKYVNGVLDRLARSLRKPETAT
jgi:N utilization substance protein B